MARTTENGPRGSRPIQVEIPVEETFAPILHEPYAADGSESSETKKARAPRQPRTVRQTSAAPTTKNAGSGEED